jgi:hypothetical protein
MRRCAHDGRRRLRWAAPAQLALLVGLAAAVAPAAASLIPPPGQRAGSVRAPQCTLPGARTMAANRHVRVFSARVRAWREVFGCRRDADRAYGIGDANPECQNYDHVARAVVTGNLVALDVRTCSLDSTQATLQLVNLRDGRVRFAAPPLASAAPQSAYDAIGAMVLTASGRVAWIGVRRQGGAIVAVEVHRRVRGSQRASTVLDGASGIDPRSLRRSGARVRWKRAGVVRSASL